MTNAPPAETSDRSLIRDIWYAARYYLGGRPTLLFLAAVFIAEGIALNWGWLVAAGLAPILLSLLPCAVMCALGLCMHKMAGSADSEAAGSAQTQTIGADDSRDRVAGTSALFDPVSQRMLSAATAIASAHPGRIYDFEDRTNRDAFEAEPEKYLSGSLPIAREVALADEAGKRPHQGHGRHGCCG